MNRYALWKYIVIAVALLLGAIYTLPNFFGEAPAVQVSSAKATVKVEPALLARVEAALQSAGIEHDGTSFDVVGLNATVRVRFRDTDTQIRARDVIERALNSDPSDPTYVVALNLVPRTPQWLIALRALPMYLGLDLRGGVHFLLQVDMKEAVTRRLETVAGDLRQLLREKNVRHGGIVRDGQTLQIRFRDNETRARAADLIRDANRDLLLREEGDGESARLLVTLSPTAIRAVQEYALKQNITTLHNRINELGVAEPVIQQQGADRVVVQLPGVQDTAKAKEILGRTATLEMRLLCESPEELAAFAAGTVPFGCERYVDREGRPLLVKRQVIITGENLNDAQAGFDSQTQEPAVHLTVDAKGARIIRDVTRENVGKRMAILLFEKGKGEVITAPVIRSELGARFQISGRMSTQEANDIALLLRAGSLAAPMEIIEERTIGPSLGAENIRRGFNATLWGFTAIAVFMIVYYGVFGVVSVIALASNLMLLIALLSLLQATLTLPGIAAIALTLGMAIDANVLINERVREELRNGRPPQHAIHDGYEKAFNTILDSNITTLIAGVALLAFGSGPVRGFAVVHCLGILTSIFSAVFVSRAIVNLIYGSRKKLTRISIGQVWRPEAAQVTSDTK
ncbi:MAG: protein translocase subunit SecD [Sutterellaceae bacterium]|nr:protein translocase subunit SecD [Burkholderiaceae bacterium]MCX7901707.1 protein translocase subunit SecD [Burkholderiaceae bacterium]MDW8429024.1 protein translocase subunit SecD [Sutterellaceae bacterium]